MLVRPETEDDRDAVRAVNVAAFDTPQEADLVDMLRGQATPIVSLVAEEDGAILGHIMFSPVSLEGHLGLKLMGLAPMAVSPSHQRRGIGSQLVGAGLEHCRQLSCAAVVVLGHPTYYPRFGFAPASEFGMRCEYDVPPEVFMALEIEPGALSFGSGTVRYHPAWKVKLWKIQ